jgi:nicotinate dehydrogenase subunit A
MKTISTKTISLKVNGEAHTLEVDPTTPLLFVLSDELGLRGPKFGCGMAQCGACTVILTPDGENRGAEGHRAASARGKAVRSCVLPVGSVGTDEVTTLEGLGTPEKPHPIQQAFIEEGAAQCGFCLSGVILTAKAALDEKPGASDEEIREALSGVLCRCFVHTRMLRAIRKYAETRKA